LFGAEAGEPGQFLVNGEPCSQAKKLEMNAADEVMMRTPGGGGSGAL